MKNLQNQNVLSINRLKPRSIVIPAGKTTMLDLPYRMPECISQGKRYFVNLTFLDGDTLVSKKQKLSTVYTRAA